MLNLILILGIFIIVTIGPIVILVVTMMLPYRIGFGKKITWGVDLRTTMPPVTKQETASCVCHAMAGLMGFHGVQCPTNPDDWYRSIKKEGVDGLTNIDIVQMLENAVGSRGYNKLSVQQVIPAITAGKPLLVCVQSIMHLAAYKDSNICFSKQNLERGHTLAAKLFSDKMFSLHAMIVCGISTDGETIMLRDSSGEDSGDKGYWAISSQMLLGALAPNIIYILGN